MTLDIYLPDMQGWRILERIKTDVAARHIPVCVISTDDSRQRAFDSGAAGFLAKPLQSRDLAVSAVRELRDFALNPVRTVLALLPEGEAREEYLARMRQESCRVLTAVDAEEAASLLATGRIDCLVLDEKLGEMRPERLFGAAANEEAAGLRRLPVVLYCPGEAPPASPWRQRGSSLSLREARSMERLLDQSWFFLHRSQVSMAPQEAAMLDSMHCSNRMLAGRKALVVDDDMRNIFALTTVLEEQGMVVISADSGHDAIQLVQEDSGIDIVLMDIMMPEMDGIETMRRIRKLERGQDLPIVAVTAKAMKGDREKCIEAGAWDYLSKPVDTTHLLAVLRAWLYR